MEQRQVSELLRTGEGPASLASILNLGILLDDTRYERDLRIETKRLKDVCLQMRALAVDAPSRLRRETRPDLDIDLVRVLLRQSAQLEVLCPTLFLKVEVDDLSGGYTGRKRPSAFSLGKFTSRKSSP